MNKKEKNKNQDSKTLESLFEMYINAPASLDGIQPSEPSRYGTLPGVARSLTSLRKFWRGSSMSVFEIWLLFG